MEACLDGSSAAVRALEAALDRYEADSADRRRLFDYYGSTQWMGDLEADEAGKLPKDLKRGVLSEDAVYDLICDNRELLLRMAKLVAGAIENREL